MFFRVAFSTFQSRLFAREWVVSTNKQGNSNIA